MKNYKRQGEQLKSFHKQQIKRPVLNSLQDYDKKVITETTGISDALPTSTLNTLDFNRPRDLLIFFLLITAVTCDASGQHRKDALTSPTLPEEHSLSKPARNVSNTDVQSGKAIASNTQASLFYQGIRANDISSQIKECKKKRHGVSTGKTCEISNIKYYLKVMEPSDKAVACNKSELLGMYNLKFIKQTMGINVPNVNLVYEKNGVFTTHSNEKQSAELYVSSQEIEHFIPGSKADKKAHKEHLTQKKISTMFNHDKNTLRRIEIVKNIGESGIAKLAVAGTFCQDLVNNDDNWGYDKQGLVIVDADHSPHTLEEYLGESSRMPGNIELDFSLHTVLSMRFLYKKMLEKFPPKMHPDIDMSPLFYKQLLYLYITACNNAISKITIKYPELSPYKPSPVVNDALRNAFIDVMQAARQNDLYSTNERYSCEITAKDTSTAVVPNPR